MSTSTPAGWYDDGHGALRWWDGTQWTEHTHVAETPTAPAAEATSHGADDTPADAPVAPSEAAASPMPPVPTAPGGYATAYPGIDPSTVQGVAAPAVAPGAPGLSGGPTAGGPTAGGPTAGGPTAGGPAKKSKLWILFVALGLVVVGMIVAAALIIPRIVGDIVDATERDSWSSSESDSPAVPGLPDEPDDSEIAPPGDPVTGAEADAAAAVVSAYDDAWNTGDCEAYHATLSDELREFGGWTCDEFAVESQFFVDSLEEYEITVVSTTREGDDIIVSTVETYLQVTDIDGIPLDVPQPGSVQYDYTLIEVDGAWVIDDITEL